jgi:ABC-type phosphate/phosphonate transport system, periplasmic component
MRRYAIALALFLLSDALHAAAPPLIFGVFPNLTPKLLIETYRPLADYLQARLHRPVALYTAPGFARFVADTRRGEFDLVLTAPHLAWLARQDSGYRPLLKYANPVRGIVVVKRDSSITSVQQLPGRRVATANPIAITVMAMQHELADAGLVAGRAFATQNAQSHNNAAMLVYDGVVDAAILGEQPFRQLPRTVQAGLRIIARSAALSGQVFLTHPRLRDAEAQAIRNALLSYAVTPQGRQFIARGGFGGLIRLDGRELQGFRQFAPETQQLLHDAR